MNSELWNIDSYELGKLLCREESGHLYYLIVNRRRYLVTKLVSRTLTVRRDEIVHSIHQLDDITTIMKKAIRQFATASGASLPSWYKSEQIMGTYKPEEDDG